MKQLLNTLISLILRHQAPSIRSIYQNGDRTQQRIFNSLIACAKNTAFGIDHHFNDIKSYTDFVQRVPVRTYELLFPYIERCLNAEKNVLWNTPITQFSKSSGTTNAQSKYIPISQQSLQDCHIKAARDFISIYLDNHPDSKMFCGKSLRLGGSLHKDKTNGIVIGDLSAILFTNTPIWANWYSTPDKTVSCMPDWKDKLPAMIAQVSKADVTSLAGVPSWMLVMLRNAIQQSGKKDLCELWPNLELYMHGGINFSPYKKVYQELIPKPSMRYYEMYNASEGFFAFQDRPNTDDMLLLLDHGIFYEFIDMKYFGTAEQVAIPIWEVKENINYAMVISTNGGLWRYLIGDTVRFTSTNPYRIRITGRTKAFINAFGEELVVENADTALHHACELTSACVREYTAGPIFMDGNNSGAHQWVIEFHTAPNDINIFVNALDTKLQELNSDYRAKRYQDTALSSPVVYVAADGLFYRWMESRGKLGGQNKVPRLSNSREFVEALMRSV